MTQDNHKIDARDRNVFDVLNEQKYTVDYFQREYSWGQKHIEQLVTDLTSTFLDAYTQGDSRTSVDDYNNYYLGPFVITKKDGIKSVVDGQQRLTSLTLFLIFLNNLQKEQGGKENIESLIFSEKYGEKSFNIQVEERRVCLEKLFMGGRDDFQFDGDESTVNMVERYTDIEAAFPEEIKGDAFPYFLDWLKYNVILVEIVAYSDDNAYAIFESMNDRGLNLTSTEMLKGYVLSRFRESVDRENANKFWKKAIQSLHKESKEEDQQFIQAWLRSQYAETIRQSTAGSSNEDFEKIGTRFHNWFRDNLSKMGLESNSSDGFQRVIHTEMQYFLQAYHSILDAQKEEKVGWENVFYIKHWGIAQSLSLPLMLAPLKSTDSQEIARQKINEVAFYIENFAVRRSVNFRKFGSSSIRYTMYSLVKEIRGKDIDSLRTFLQARLNQMEESWDGICGFRLHGQNRRFVKFLLSRISGFIDQKSGASTNFSTYFVSPGTKPFEVEHIWADKFEEHRDEFEQQHDFNEYRNRIGSLVLLPRGTNQSYGAKPYSDKLELYFGENLLVKSLHNRCYENNPNFINMYKELDLPFQAHSEFKKNDIEQRQNLIKLICEEIWATVQ